VRSKVWESGVLSEGGFSVKLTWYEYPGHRRPGFRAWMVYVVVWLMGGRE